MPLAGEDAVEVKPLGLIAQVLLTDPCGFVAYLAQLFDKKILRVIKAGGLVIFKAIFMAVLTCEYGCPAGAAYGVGDIGAIEYHSLFGNSIYPWGFPIGGTIRTDSLVGMVIGDDDENIGLLFLLGRQK